MLPSSVAIAPIRSFGLIFVADHIRIPADPSRMELADRDRYQRVRETLGRCCGIVELARVEEGDAARWVMESAAGRGIEIEQDAARELVDALGADMMLVSSELEKLMLYAAAKRRVTLREVETMVLAAKQRSLYELTDAISSQDRARALATLHSILSAGEGDDAAIGHLYMLARIFRQMLVLLERKARDARSVWQALWPGFRVPPFAARDLIRQARRYDAPGGTKGHTADAGPSPGGGRGKSRGELLRALRLIARADLELRSNPASKRLVLERLVLDLASQPEKSPAP